MFSDAFDDDDDDDEEEDSIIGTQSTICWKYLFMNELCVIIPLYSMHYYINTNISTFWLSQLI